jgi:glycerophosphoryl diester phosphodiesterase
VDRVLKVVREAGAATRTTLQSFDWRTLLYAQRVAPDVLTVYLTEQQGNDTVEVGQPGASPWLAGLDVDDHAGSVPRLVRAAGGKTWSPAYRDLTPEALAEARALGLRVVPWTVNRPEDMESLIDRGVDGLITDRPDLARRVMERKGLRLPAPTPATP